MDTVGPRMFLKFIAGGTLLIADHQVFVAAGGRSSWLLAVLLVAFNLVYLLACFPQLLVGRTLTSRCFSSLPSQTCHT